MVIERIKTALETGEWWGSWWRDSRYYEDGRYAKEESDRAFAELKETFDAKFFLKYKNKIHIHPLLPHLLAEGLMPFHYLVSLGLQLYCLSNVGLLGDLKKRLRDPEQFFGAEFELKIIALFLRHGYSIQRDYHVGKGRKNCDLRLSKGAEVVFVEIKRLEDLCQTNKEITWRAWNIFRDRIQRENVEMIGGEPLSIEAEINKVITKIEEAAQNQLPDVGAGIVIVGSPIAFDHVKFEEVMSEHLRHLPHLSAVVFSRPLFSHQDGICHRIYFVQNPFADVNITSFDIVDVLHSMGVRETSENNN